MVASSRKIRDTRVGYRTPARLLHWLVAVFVLATIPAGLAMTAETTPDWLSGLLFLFHKNGGTMLFAVMTARLLWRLWSPPAPLPADVPDWQRRAAGLSHGALYVLLFFMITTGYLRTVGGGFPVELLDALGVPPLLAENARLEEIALWLHETGKFVIGALIVVHVGAASHHALGRRDGVIRRMWPPVRASRG